MDALVERQIEFERAWLLYEFHDKTVERLVELIGREKHRLTHRPGRGPRPHYTFPLLGLNNQTLASLTVQAIAKDVALNTNDTQPSYIDIAQSILDTCYWCWRARKTRHVELPDIVASQSTATRFRGPNGNARLQALQTDVAEFEKRDWRSPEGDSLGGFLLELACAIGMVYSVVQTHIAQGTTIRRIYPSSDFVSVLNSTLYKSSEKLERR